MLSTKCSLMKNLFSECTDVWVLIVLMYSSLSTWEATRGIFPWGWLGQPYGSLCSWFDTFPGWAPGLAAWHWRGWQRLLLRCTSTACSPTELQSKPALITPAWQRKCIMFSSMSHFHLEGMGLFSQVQNNFGVRQITIVSPECAVVSVCVCDKHQMCTNDYKHFTLDF